MTQEQMNFVILLKKKKTHKCAREAPLASQAPRNYISIL